LLRRPLDRRHAVGVEPSFPRSAELRAEALTPIFFLEELVITHKSYCWTLWPIVRMERPLPGCPEGTNENSPALQRWVFGAGRKRVPSGTTEGVSLKPCFLSPLQGSEGFVGRCPSDESLGYDRSSLWDWWSGGSFPGPKTPG